LVFIDLFSWHGIHYSLKNIIMNRTSISVYLLLLSLTAASQDSTKRQYTIFKPVPKELMRKDMETDRPDITESPFTVDAGHIQYESDFVRLKSSTENGILNKQTLVEPFTLKLGIAARVDIQFAWEPYRNEEHKGSDGSDSTYRNPGSVGIRFKYNLLGNYKGNFSLAILPYMRFPTHRFFEHHGLEYGLMLPAEWKINDKWALGFQEEADIMSTEEGHAFQVLQSVVLDYELADKCKFIAETFYTYDFSEHSIANFVNCGIQYDVVKNFALDGGIQQGLSHDAGHQYYIGLSWRL